VCTENLIPFGQKIRTIDKDGELSVLGVASPGAAGYDFFGKQLRIGWRGGRMDWARILAFVTGMVDQELLARIEYLAAENRILKAQLKGRLKRAFIGRKEPDFPGGLVPNHALQGTGEWAYGITDWWEMGFYTPYAVDQELTPYSNAIKIRQLFVIPNAAEREFFYGVNFEFSYAMPQFLDTRWLIEMRPIVGWRKGDYEFTRPT
jgi:hypothetical protein